MIGSLRGFREKDIFGCERRLGIYKQEYDAIPDSDIDAKEACIYRFHKQEFERWKEIFGTQETNK